MNIDEPQTRNAKRSIKIRALAGQSSGDVRILDAIDDGKGVKLWLGASDRPLGQLSFGNGDTEVELESVPGGFCVRLPSWDGKTVPVTVRGRHFCLQASKPDNESLSGQRVVMGARYSESADDILCWLQFHKAAQGATAALVLNLGGPGTTEGLFRDLNEASLDWQVSGDILIVDPSIDLGHRDLPAASHPFNAPSAPGKSRMVGIEAEPERSPLGESLVYEILHRRYLTRARSVVNVDVCDLVLPQPDKGNVFERAEASDGYISLVGVEAYFWSVDSGKRPIHADHIYVPFDSNSRRKRWAVGGHLTEAFWRTTRIAGLKGVDQGDQFVRCMGIRHPDCPISTIVPKTSLVEDPTIAKTMELFFEHAPNRAPTVQLEKKTAGSDAVTIVTCMKNEGPFILEWLAHHRAIGVERFLVYTNDCDDGTEELLDLLQSRGLVEHRQNPFRETGQRPQHAAFHAAELEPLVQESDWILPIDVDEFVNIHVGDGRISDLFTAVPEANMISLTWRLFGNADIHTFRDEPVTRQFRRCAREFARKPHQAWGFKTLYKRLGIFKKIGVHRPKGLIPQLKNEIFWVNGSGQKMPETFYRNAWRSTVTTYGYDLATLNHYAVRNAESFLVKRDRGRVNHVDRDQGLLYWFRMNNNETEDCSIDKVRTDLESELDRLLSDKAIAQKHQECVSHHRRKIRELLARPDYARFYGELTGERMEKLSRLHARFGSGVFWSGPHVVPDEVVARDPADPFFFTVDPVGKGH